MTYAVVENGITSNLIEIDPDIAKEWGCKEYYDGCEIGEPYRFPHPYTDLELAQQEITDRELDTIEQGQAITDLELLSITQNQAINVMTGGNLNDNL